MISKVPMNLLDVMKRLYDSELNCGFHSESDSSVRVWLGGGHNNCDAEQWFGMNEFEQMATWLDQEARLYYPDSAYAKPQSLWATS